MKKNAALKRFLREDVQKDFRRKKSDLTFRKQLLKTIPRTFSKSDFRKVIVQKGFLEKNCRKKLAKSLKKKISKENFKRKVPKQNSERKNRGGIERKF